MASFTTLVGSAPPATLTFTSKPGTEGTVRGFSRVALLVIDEAARVSDPLYYAVRPMLAVSGGKLVALSTPFGQKGHFWQEW